MDDRVVELGERSAPPKTEEGQPSEDRRVGDRRKVTVRSFLQGAFVPRRRRGRRESDQYLPIDWHDPYLMFLSVVMLLLSVTDAFMTVRLIGDGAIETNPVLALVLNEYPALFAAVKMALTGFSVIVLVAVARVRLLGVIPARWVFQLLVLAYFALVMYERWLVGQMLQG